MRYTVVGMGYVGMAMATLLATKYQVYAVDIDKSIIDKINNNESPINDDYVKKYLLKYGDNIKATTDPIKKGIYKKSDFVIISTPTNYDVEKREFDTSTVEKVVEEIIKENEKVSIIIKSTIPVGFTEKLKRKMGYDKIYFSPEFLREGKALYDNLYPSRIIVGGNCSSSINFATTLKELSKHEVTILNMSNTEAEAVKLFSNTYLAMRVAFFNELDMYAESLDLQASEIIKGMGLDSRIGNEYNNPSFGYGGYCLPKDSKQLLSNYENVGLETSIIKAIVESNSLRARYISHRILEKKPKLVGIYSLSMKKDSDNHRNSSVFNVLEIISSVVEVCIYDENIQEDFVGKYKIINDFEEFINNADLIVTNRMDDRLLPHINKVYTRDVFYEN